MPLRNLLIMALLLNIPCMPGCSATSYSPPQQHSFTQSRVVTIPYDELWKMIISYVGGTFFSIDAIEKDSGLINLSFLVNDASRYIDCGESVIKGASDRSISESSPHINLYGCTFTTSLSGKVNIIASKIESGKSRIKVNILYTVRRLVDCPGHRNYTGPFTYSLSFTSNSSGAFGVRTCFPSGTLETEILDGILAAKESD